MKWPRSLKGQFVLGSVLWTLGLLGASHLAFVYVTQFVPHILVIQHWAVLGMLAAVFMLGGLTQVRRGLSPVNQLRSRLAAVRDGTSARVHGDYPGEVQPLVDDLNALLAHREDAVRRAQARAGDLAHGLQTPLAVLTQDVDEMARAGHDARAAVMRQSLATMGRRIEYHLAQARAAASAPVAGTRTRVADAIDGLVRTMRRLHAERPLVIDVINAQTAEAVVAVERQDLDEMVGNLLDNACKWARTRVAISVGFVFSSVAISITDDGPGLDEAQCAAVLRRGVRADDTTPGSGLGLAIVRELTTLYGGSVWLRRAPSGGLHAVLMLPAPDPARIDPGA